jgi:acetoacetyl-CoA synthetase
MAAVCRPVPADARATSRVGAFMDWLAAERGRTFTEWDALQRWSCTDIEDFWEAVWQYFAIASHRPYTAVLDTRKMPGARWFDGAHLNYVERSLGTDGTLDDVAVIAMSQTRPDHTMTFRALRDEVRRVRQGLADQGVSRGDRVVGYLPNIPEALIAFLATASLGATWAACAPEFGSQSVIDRFAQIEPTAMIVVGGYTYGTKSLDRRDEVARIRAAIPSLRSVISVPYGEHVVSDDVIGWADLGVDDGRSGTMPACDPVPFAHPLMVLFSSGTTGLPKAIIHGHGGILLETLKNHSFHWDLGPGDRLSWYSTTAWMMWNSLVGALLVGSSIVMQDGNPAYPDAGNQWRIAAETGATVLGLSPGVVMASRREGIEPARQFDLSALRQISVAGSPLPREGFEWIYQQFDPSVLLNVGSGGTDICTGMIQASPLTPVFNGAMSGPSLGFATTAFDERGMEVFDELGELVITSPVPSMPVGFWNDPDQTRYRDTYFDHYPGVWRHGDWVRFDTGGGVTITGRSDATLNRGGVRLGTAEFYRVVEELSGVQDSLIVHLEDPDAGMGRLVLFIVTDDGVVLDDDLRAVISREIRAALSPRHVPDEIHQIPGVPYSRTGKKLEIPVKRILLGADPHTVASPGALADPSALDYFSTWSRAEEKA